MRGYRVLKKSGRIGQITCVKQALTERSLGIQKKDFSFLVMGAGVVFSELIVRQYLLVLFGGLDLNRALLIASAHGSGKVVFPIPGEWRNVLIEHGFKVARIRSAFLWGCYIFYYLIYGVFKSCKVIVTGALSGTQAGDTATCYAYFDGLSTGNIPQPQKESHDVISWYENWQGRNTEIAVIRHGVSNSLPTITGTIPVCYQRNPFPPLSGFLPLSSYFFWALKACFIALYDVFFGRWWHALLLNQAALAAQVRYLPAFSIAREYLFHNSNWIWRPLWTYEAEQKGSSVLFYFYSTNCEGFKRSDGYPPIPFGWKTMNWSRYLVWDEYQADFVKRVVGEKSNISVVGEIWFSDTPKEALKLPEGSIAVFDVQPVRSSYYVTLGLDFEYYTPLTALQFLEDVQVVLSEHNCLLALKRKRHIGKLADAQYRNYIDQLGRMNNFVAVDPDINASLLVRECKAVISMPYTSTALLGRNLGKPSIYYDPKGLLQKDDRAAHGIEIVQGREELARWLKDIL